MNYTQLLSKPGIIAVIADINEGKSMLLYDMIETWRDAGVFNLYTYGLRVPIKGARQVYSVAELEGVKNSVIIIDELASLFDLDNRKIKAQIENSLRLLHHNNNVVVLAGPGENHKKFLSGKYTAIFYKKCTVADLINGSRVKHVLMSYNGPERGSEILALPKNRALFWDGRHYSQVAVRYFPDYDTKADNEPILYAVKQCAENVPEIAERL